MNYELLKNKIYLTLLANYNNQTMPSFVKLSQIVGITRQTASTRVKELIDKDLISINEENKVIVSNPLNIDINKLKGYLENTNEFNPVELKLYLFSTENKQNKTQLAKELNISRSSLYLDQHTVVYGIYSEGKIKYIGTTQHYEDRIAQHIKKRPYLTPANFIILADSFNKNNFNVELDLIHLLQPEWNEVGNENHNN